MYKNPLDKISAADYKQIQMLADSVFGIKDETKLLGLIQLIELVTESCDKDKEEEDNSSYPPLLEMMHD